MGQDSVIRISAAHEERFKSNLLCCSFSLRPHAIHMLVQLLCCLLRSAFASTSSGPPLKCLPSLDIQQYVSAYQLIKQNLRKIQSYCVTELPNFQLFFHPFELLCFLLQLLDCLLKFRISATK